MTAAEEVKRTAAEQKAPAAKEKKVTKAAPKEKKVTKTAKSTKTASHPTYFEMIKEAVLALNERSGSSPYAIAKYMEEKHKSVLPANFRKILGLQLKNSAAKGKLTKIKASYKLSDAAKKEKSTAAVKKPTVAAAKKPRATKAASTTAAAGTKRKAEAKKKVTAKKATPVKAKAKAPKSIKSPAKKRARKAVAA